MKIAIACDPAGMPLKGPIEETLTELGIEYVDLGMHEGDCRDYPVFALRVANKVISKECDLGIVLCGGGDEGGIVERNECAGGADAVQ